MADLEAELDEIESILNASQAQKDMKEIEGKLAEVEQGLKIANTNNAKIEMDVSDTSREWYTSAPHLGLGRLGKRNLPEIVEEQFSFSQCRKNSERTFRD